MKNFNINKIIRPHLLSLKTYDAVNPPDLLSKKSGIPENDLIKLNGNENPYGASPKAIAALKNLLPAKEKADLTLLCDLLEYELCDNLAQWDKEILPALDRSNKKT